MDPPDVLNRKIDSAICSSSNDDKTTENGLLSFFKFVVVPIQIQNSTDKIFITKISDTSQINEFSNFEEISSSFYNNSITETDLKNYLKEFLNGILSKVNKQSQSEQIREIIQKAYPKINEKISEKITEKGDLLKNVENLRDIDFKTNLEVNNLCVKF